MLNWPNSSKIGPRSTRPIRAAGWARARRRERRRDRPRRAGAAVRRTEFPRARRLDRRCASFETPATRAPQDEETPVSAINNIPHAEEHSAGVRLEARITPMQPYSRCSLQCRSGPAVRERLSKRLEAGAGAALDA